MTAKERYDYRKVHGICVACGVRDAFARYVRCPECLEKGYLASARCREDPVKRMKYNAHGRYEQKERRERQKKDGLCIRCGRKVKNGVYCEYHRLKRNEARREKRGRSPGERFRERIDRGVCMYCEDECVEGYKLCNRCLNRARENIRHANEKKSARWRKEIGREWDVAKRKNSGNT